MTPVTDKKTDRPKPETRTIAVAGFPYRAVETDGLTGEERIIHRFAVRGDVVELHDPKDVERGENCGAFGDPVKPPLAYQVFDLGLMSDDQIFDLFADKPPAVKDVLSVIGKDKDLARRVLAAERGTGNEPRQSMVDALEKIAASTGDDEDDGAGD